MTRLSRLVGFLVVLVLFAGLTATAAAQGPVRAEAYAGEPFGVGRLEVQLSESMAPRVLGAAGLLLLEKNGRVLYPAIESRGVPEMVTNLLNRSRRPVARLLGQVLEQPGKTSIHFLFTQNTPLELTLVSQRSDSFVATPIANPAEHQRMFQAWWRQYTAGPGLLEKKPDYPPMVDNYLRAMLARRLGLPLAAPSKGETWKDILTEELGLELGTESMQIAVLRERFLGAALPLGAKADQPLPAPIDVRGEAIAAPAVDVEVEPLAMRAPEECFYARFGSFANFLWFQDTMTRWGNDFQNLVATRGLDYPNRQRFETGLALQTTALARLLGDAIIADAAIVGTDLFLREGAAIGVLFKAWNTTLLGTDLARQRKERAQKGRSVTDKKIKIDGREVSFLSSPDGLVRSYYVVDGDYHFVTSSKRLVRRFLETAGGKGSLGASSEFRHARTVMPLGRNDTAMVYLSTSFFQNFVSPPYRVEMARRLQALADIELVEMALLASAAEGKAGDTIEELVAGEFLPPDFGPRPDGSRTVLSNGEVRDSLRGSRGSFTPIPDVEVTQASAAEVEAYRHFGEFLEANWKPLDPVLVGIQRRDLGSQRERIVVDLRMSPLTRRNYERLIQQVGQPDGKRLAPIPADSVALEAILPKQRIFAGIQSVGLPGDAAVDDQRPLLGLLRNIVVGYLGTTKDASLLGVLSDRIAIPGLDGLVWSELGALRRDTEEFSVFSFQREVLESVAGQLRYEDAQRPAQFRLRAADLSNARLTPFLNRWGYSQTRDTSVGNIRLMHQLVQQLQVPGDRAKTTAELLLGAKLICPLGGDYVYRKTTEGVGFWTSTTLEEIGSRGRLTPPEGYQAPPLNWFRGLSMDALLNPDALSAHVEVDMQWPEARPAATPGSRSQ